MANVPLCRPSFPDPQTWLPKWQLSTAATGQYSNFGPLWHEAAERLSLSTGRVALPCSTGTEAVALAIAAFGQASVYYEAFTFEATRSAALRSDQYAIPFRPAPGFPSQPEPEDVIVRTIPFGSKREFRESDNSMVIDAAGAFDGHLTGYPRDALIACSFHATKNYPIGEGGCVFIPRGWNWAINNVRRAMNFGIDPVTRAYVPGIYATNAKLDEMRSAMLLAQLDRADYFSARSARIAEQSRLIALNTPGTFLPYTPGCSSQSLLVVGHHEPDKLVNKLAESGFVARRVYHPFIREDLLDYNQSRMVALPSDTTDKEFYQLIDVMRGLA